MKKRRFVRQAGALGAALLLNLGRAEGTGYYGPRVYLDDGGRKVMESPEFYWELETKRIANQLHPYETAHRPANGTAPDDEQASRRATAQAEETDFADALKTGRLKVPDAAAASRAQEAVRAVLDRTDPKTTEALPSEWPSEFADYHRGAFAYRRGPEHWSEARAAWEQLLQRPAAERHYRTVWAAFMLGRLAIKQNDPATAIRWFQRVRELTRDGFADSLGLAGSPSYGWEARGEWKEGNPEKAARLYLTQLSLGEESAIVSLKALIPDRQPVEGMLNYGPETILAWKARADEAEKELKRAAKDPILRRLVTVHILATASVPDEFAYSQDQTVNRCERWLKIINELKLEELDDAEYIGWVAYNNGDYTGAQRWLKLVSDETPAALWLRSKLESRAGKIADAARSMAQVWQTVRDRSSYTGWSAPAGENAEGDEWLEWHWSLSESAAGDLGALQLERSDFIEALDILLAGGLWIDAAFLAERVLTVEELTKYVDQHPAAEPAQPGDLPARLRYLLGRRLVRVDQYEKARGYLPGPYDQVLDRYAAALKQGHDKTRSKKDRARALFTAAWLARFDGMELMGTEGAPDGFAFGGDFPVPDLGAQMRSGVYRMTSYSEGEASTKTAAISLRVPAQLRHRLTKSQVSPDLRFHYRIIAAALAVEAAKLLPEESDELADVLNRAGLWVKDEDEKLGNRYYNLIEGRAANTTIGRAVIARQWFVDQSGRWSDEERQAHEAMHRELNLPVQN